jgi:CheY-like chemotaxis protein
LYLPECTNEPGSPAPVPQATRRGAGQALVVVDDEPALVVLAGEMLKGLGYAPVGYTDPVAALAAIREAPHRFAAVITDEAMPGMSGTELTMALRQQAPRLPVLLISGYGGALLASRAEAAGVTRVLTKPLRRAELAQALADLLS